MAERITKTPQLDFLERIAQAAGERQTSQKVHDWWFEQTDEKFRQLAQTFINLSGSNMARQAHLDVTDDISLEMGAIDLSDDVGNTFNSARSYGISAEEIVGQVNKRAKDLERRSGIPGWSHPLTYFTIDVLAKKWGLSERKVAELKKSVILTSRSTQP